MDFDFDFDFEFEFNFDLCHGQALELASEAHEAEQLENVSFQPSYEREYICCPYRYL